MKRIILVDGNALIHRAFHAIPPLNSPDGQLVNAVYGFFSILLSAIKTLEPDYAVVAVDVSGPTFRDTLYDQYKATRSKTHQSLYDQIPIIHHIVKAFEIPLIGVAGFEADDVIGTLAYRIKNQELGIKNTKSSTESSHDSKFMIHDSEPIETIIVTGDKDAYQLIDQTTKVFTMRQSFKDTILMDEQAIKDKYGFMPIHITDYKALAGDASDNIPGVPGIGDKTACKLIIEYGDIETILKNVDKLPTTIANKIKGNEHLARLSKELATIHKEVPFDFDLEKAKLDDFDQDYIEKEFLRLGMKSIVARLPQSTRKVESHTQETLL